MPNKNRFLKRSFERHQIDRKPQEQLQLPIGETPSQAAEKLIYFGTAKSLVLRGRAFR